MLLERMDPFLAEFDRLTKRVLETPAVGLPMDVLRHENEVVFHFDIPGATPDSINVTLDGAVLEVTATRQQVASEGAQFVVQERPNGQITRRITLGEWGDAEHVAAEYVDGVLTVKVPIAEKAKPRRIEISSGQASKQLTA